MIRGGAVAPPLLKACSQTQLCYHAPFLLAPIFSTCSYPSDIDFSWDTHYKSVGLCDKVEFCRDTEAVLLGHPGTCSDCQHSRAQGYPKRGAHLCWYSPGRKDLSAAVEGYVISTDCSYGDSQVAEWWLCHWGALLYAGYGSREMSVLAIHQSLGHLVFL